MATFLGEQLLIKLWDTLVDKGVGSLLKPWQSRREAKAERENLLFLAQTERISQEIKAGKKQVLLNSKIQLIDTSFNKDVPDKYTTTLPPEFLTLVSNIHSEIFHERLQKEINISKAILQAEEILKHDDSKPSNRYIDEDWILRWRENAGNSTKAHLQELWGKILSGELKNPGQYSFRTLEFLRTLSAKEAEFISKNFSFVIDNRFLLHDLNLLARYGFTINTRLQLQQLGLISGAEGTLNVTYVSSAR